MGDEAGEENNYKFTLPDGSVTNSSRDYSGQGRALYANGETYEGAYVDGVISFVMKAQER